MKSLVLSAVIVTTALTAPAYASQAYGTLNNFDVVNDTGEECHGFEIELEDVHSRDITYCYGYNHYGPPTIVEDNTDPLHPICYVQYLSKKNPDGTWASYTAIPDGPIDPTNGHMFTNPNINFGGEHFGVGFYGVPAAVRYFWLLDDGAGNLVRGPMVDIATPTFTYRPAAGGAPAQVQAAIQRPEPVEVHPKAFGDASWVKVTRTVTHNNNRVALEDLVSDDPDDPEDRNWKNGEPDEVEFEWELMQTEFSKLDGGANAVLENAPEDLNNGDEVVTVRYDFYAYTGPFDDESGEAKASKVGPDGVHGEGIKTINGVEVDLSTVEVVGDYIGAQMAGFDAGGQMGLIENLQNGIINEPYVERRVVIDGTPPILTTVTGDLPAGMTFDVVEGILSGTPEVSGVFNLTVDSIDATGAEVTADYELTIESLVPGDAPPTCAISAPTVGETISGRVDLTATAADDNGVEAVTWYLDDELLADTVDPFTYRWNTKRVANGPHTLMAYAYDNAGNAGPSEPVMVTVENIAPQITSQPPTGDHEAGTMYKYDMTATGSPAPRFFLDAGPENMRLARRTGLLRWKPDGTQLGETTVTVRIKNLMGEDTQTWTVNVVDTKAPTRPQELTAVDVTSNSAALSWAASKDRVGVAGYKLYEWYRNSKEDKGWRVREGNLTETSALVTGLAPGEAYRYRVSAFDASGNESSWSARVLVTTLP